MRVHLHVLPHLPATARVVHLRPVCCRSAVFIHPLLLLSLVTPRRRYWARRVREHEQSDSRRRVPRAQRRGVRSGDCCKRRQRSTGIFCVSSLGQGCDGADNRCGCCNFPGRFVPRATHEVKCTLRQLQLRANNTAFLFCSIHSLTALASHVPGGGAGHPEQRHRRLPCPAAAFLHTAARVHPLEHVADDLDQGEQMKRTKQESCIVVVPRTVLSRWVE